MFQKGFSLRVIKSRDCEGKKASISGSIKVRIVREDEIFTKKQNFGFDKIESICTRLLNVAQVMISVFVPVFGYQHFLLFLQCFQKPSFVDHKKQGLNGKDLTFIKPNLGDSYLTHYHTLPHFDALWKTF